MLLYKFIIFQYTNDGFVLKQTRSCLEKVGQMHLISNTGGARHDSVFRLFTIASKKTIVTCYSSFCSFVFMFRN